jgi:hypothetical protein
VYLRDESTSQGPAIRTRSREVILDMAVLPRGLIICGVNDESLVSSDVGLRYDSPIEYVLQPGESFLLSSSGLFRKRLARIRSHSASTRATRGSCQHLSALYCPD